MTSLRRLRASLVARQLESTSNAAGWVQSFGQEDPWRREWLPTPVVLPGESHGQRSLVATVHGVEKSWT